MAIDNYISHLETEGRRHKTTRRYRGILDTFSAFAGDAGVHRLGQITLPLIDQYRAERKTKLKPKSMHNEAAVLKCFFKWSKLRKLIRENPLEGVTFAKPILPPRGGPSLAEIDRILAAAPERIRTMLTVLTFTGMRSGELQRLRPVDLDLDGNWLHIVSREGGETKTGHSRKVPIHPRLRPLLEALPRHKRPWLFTAAPSRKYPRGDHHISTKHLNEDFVKLLQSLGLPHGRANLGYTIHSLRHSFETITVNSRIPQRVVDTWLGHRSDRSMASVYYRLGDEESQRFMQEVPFGTDAGKARQGEDRHREDAK